jgi:hypothetical protein
MRGARGGRGRRSEEEWRRGEVDLGGQALLPLAALDCGARQEADHDDESERHLGWGMGVGAKVLEPEVGVGRQDQCYKTGPEITSVTKRVRKA